MPPELHYPDVATPPGWPYFRQGLQIRLVPPGRMLDDAEQMIIVSPLIPRETNLPPPDKLIEETIFAEARQRLEVLSQKGPVAVKTAAGMVGVAYEVVGFVRPRSPREKRIYAIYSDPVCYSAISYLAMESVFDRHVETFWKTARSLRPFRGSQLKPTGLSPDALIYSD